MSYGTCESAGEKSIGLDQDKKKNWMREGQTNEPQSKTGVGQSNPRWQPNWTIFLSHEFIYTEQATPERENAHTRLNRAFASI